MKNKLMYDLIADAFKLVRALKLEVKMLRKHIAKLNDRINMLEAQRMLDGIQRAEQPYHDPPYKPNFYCDGTPNFPPGLVPPSITDGNTWMGSHNFNIDYREFY